MPAAEGPCPPRAKQREDGYQELRPVVNNSDAGGGRFKPAWAVAAVGPSRHTDGGRGVRLLLYLVTCV